MKQNNLIAQVYINDICNAIPYYDFKSKMKIISDLEDKKRKGHIIRGIEVDDVIQCIIYTEPNYEKIYN